MECYECLQEGMTREAAGLCHHCSAALCGDHICEVQYPIALTRILAGTMVLPNRARILLCRTCKPALEQIPSEHFEASKDSRNAHPFISAESEPLVAEMSHRL